MFARRNICLSFIACLLVSRSYVEAQGKCRPIKLKGSQVLKICSRSNFARSVCSVECKPGFEKVGGGTRKVCWCTRRYCSWQGPSPVCETKKCPTPDVLPQHIKKVNDWKTGFSVLVEIDRDLLGSIYQWSLVVAFEKPLDKESLLITWDALLTNVSPDKNIFTLISANHNKNLTDLSNTENIRVLFIVTGVAPDFPRSGHIGIFKEMVRDASCIKTTNYTPFLKLQSIIPPKTTTLRSTTTTTKMSTTTPPIPQTTTSTTTSTRATTTTKATTTTTTKATTTPRPTTETSDISTIKSTTTTNRKMTIFQTTTKTSSTEGHSQLKLIHGRFCMCFDKSRSLEIKTINTDQAIMQNHERPYSAEAGWEDSGASYFSGNAYALPEIKLFDWEVLMVFNKPIASIEVWNCLITGHSESGHMWTLGPQSWNTVLNAEMLDIAFLAKIVDLSRDNPVALVYLCSNQFSEGDVIFTGPNDVSFYKHIQSEKNEQTATNTTSSPFLLSLNPTPTTHARPPFHELENINSTAVLPNTEPRSIEMSPRCQPDMPRGVPVSNARQTKPGIRRNKDNTKYNYRKLIHLSILFYEAQKAGFLPTKYRRIPWRGHSALKDGCDIGVDLSKGWYDAGDHVKFNFPMAFSVTMLSWGGMLFRDAYKDAMELDKFLKSLIWPVQYFIACHISKYELVGQIGKPREDHEYWGRPEEMNMPRPTFKITSEAPGSDLAAETAAALASASIVLKKTHRKLALKAIRHAEELYEFADKYRGRYDASIIQAREFYSSVNGYDDELLWGAAWLYIATGKTFYLDKAKQIYEAMKAKYFTGPVVSWDNKLAAAQALLANITGEDIFRGQVINFCDKMMALPKTPDGIMFYDIWAPNRYAANVAFIAIVASTLEPPLPKRQQYYEFARKQIHALVGDAGKSWVVGFGKNYPKNVHHRASSCPPYPGICTEDSALKVSTPNPYIIYGGLVGGANAEGTYFNDRKNYQQSEVACDYNAGFQSAVAGLQQFAIIRRKNKKHFSNLHKKG